METTVNITDEMGSSTISITDEQLVYEDALDTGDGTTLVDADGNSILTQ